MTGLLELLLSSAVAEIAAVQKSDRRRERASDRVAQAFEAVAGGPPGGLTPDQIAFAKGDRDRSLGLQEADGAAEAAPAAKGVVGPMRTRTASQPVAADPYLGWQRGLGSSEGPGCATAVNGAGGGGTNWRDLLRALGPALMMADPLGRNQGMAVAMMHQNGEHREAARAAESENATKRWLIDRGMDEGIASMMMRDPVLLRQWFGERQASRKADREVGTIYDE